MSGGHSIDAVISLSDVATLRLRLADLVRLRDEHATQGRTHFVAYLEAIIAETEAALALAEQPEPPTPDAT